MSNRSDRDDRWEEVWEVFHEAIEHALGERRAFLVRRCGENSELRREVEELLTAHEEGSPILDSSLPVDRLVDGREEETELWEGGRLSPGTVVAERFEIVRRIGAGGMGEVYEAEDLELGRRVALKTLLADAARKPSSLARFRREIHLAQQVTHRNVCRVFDLARDGELVFLTMELLEGETLAGRLERQGRLSLTQTETILEQVVAALEAAHEVGVVHRDLKPSNVILMDEPSGLRAVVTDFGLATSGGPSTQADTALTKTGQIVGTPAYMAPEQLEGKEVSPASDVYALGLLLFEVVTGEPPYTGTSAFSIASRRLQGSAPSPREHLPDLDERWERVILRCLERHPADRFQHPREVIRAIRERSTRVGSSARSRKSRLWVVSAAAILAVLAVVTGWLVWQRDRSPEPATGATEQASETAATEPASRAAAEDETAWFEEQDAVLVADFQNQTGDPALDGVLGPALSRALSNSPHVAVASRGRISGALRLMRLPPDTPIDDELAREVALRDPGIRAVLTGAIREIGGDVRLTVELIAPEDESVLASWSETTDPEDAEILAQLERLSVAIREHLGETVDQLRAEGEGLERVTTSSLRALRLFDEAEAIIARFGMDATAEELLREAIREDPEFASAHLLLAFAIKNQDRSLEDYLPHAERAMELADTVPDRERYFIRAAYFHFVGDEDKAIANYRALLRLHPDHYWANSNIRFLLPPTAAIPYNVRKARYRPNDLDANWDAAHALAIVGGRPDEAQPFIDRVVELAAIEIPRWQDHEAAWARLWGSHRKWLEDDLDETNAELDRWARTLEAQSGSEAAWTRNLLVWRYRTLGLADRAMDLLPVPDERLTRRFYRGLSSFLAGDDRGTVAELGGEGWADRWWGDLLLQDPLRVAGLARAGRIDEARAVLESFRSHPRDATPELTASVEKVEAQMAAEVALVEDGPGEAARQLEEVLRRDRSNYSPSFFLAAQALASAYERLGNPGDAVVILERAVDERARSYPFGTELWLRTQLQLAALHRELGDAEEAERLEDELRVLTRLADPDFWLVQELERIEE